VLVGVCDPDEERVIEETPDELHADGETGGRLAHGKGERRVAGIDGGPSTPSVTAYCILAAFGSIHPVKLAGPLWYIVLRMIHMDVRFTEE
jgi:hypothetical protein